MQTVLNDTDIFSYRYHYVLLLVYVSTFTLGKKLIAFGNEAEEKFQQLSETGAEGTACFLYRNFKLHTFGNEVYI